MGIIAMFLFIAIFLWVLYQVFFGHNKPVPGATTKPKPNPHRSLPTQHANIIPAYRRKKSDVVSELNSRPSVTSARHSRPSASDEELILTYLPNYSGMGLSFLAAVALERQREGDHSFVEPVSGPQHHPTSSSSNSGGSFHSSTYSSGDSYSGSDSCDSGGDSGGGSCD